jgi:hypothetical protein
MMLQDHGAGLSGLRTAQSGQVRIDSRRIGHRLGELLDIIAELASTLGVAMTEVFRHPDVPRKNPTEASTATW